METPMIKDLATWYVKTKTNYPQIPLIGTKRDIDAAFTRCRIHPDDAALFSTEFSVRAHGEDVCVIFFYMVLPFGFTGSPGIFGRMTQGVKWLRSQFTPENPLWNGTHNIRSEIFVDDGMFIEACIGNRAQQSVEKWEWCATLIMGPTAISTKKLELEGTWENELVLLGYHVNLQSDVISLPDPKVVGAYNLIHQSVFNPGNYTIPLQSMQELRGCLNRWSSTNRLWRWLVEPVNQLLGQTDTGLQWIRSSNSEKWLAFWHVIQFLREVAVDETDWKSLFVGVFSELVGVYAEMSLPNDNRRCIWFSGGATPTCFAGINWSTREFFCESPDRFIFPLPTERKNESPH